MTQLAFSSNAKPSRTMRDLGIVIDGDTVAFPGVLQALAKRYRRKTVLQVLSMLEAAPTEVAQELGWNHAEIAAATEHLKRKLHDAFPDDPEFDGDDEPTRHPPTGVKFR